ncbi:MAG TPA: cytochrome c [Pyrinomonadaceae bacterium]
MKLFALALACTALSLVVIACTETATTTNTSTPSAASPAKPVDDLAAAKTNYAKDCASCHAESGEGGPVKTPQKEIKVPSLKSDHAKSRTDEQLTKMIHDGEEEMPAFKDKMSATEIADMVRLIRKQFQGK